MAQPSSSSQRPLVSIKATDIARVHTCLALAAFLTSLFLGCLFHYKKIVKNGVAGYPQEWFPSVSATIGDWYPERSVFHILIALNSGPRFALVFLQYYLRRSDNSSLPLVVLISGLLRTLSCGGWVYITSNDDHDAHDVLMIIYILCNIPWMFGGIACTPKSNTKANQRRRLFATTFFLSIVPMVYFFVQHKVHEIPGAYTKYAFFEWTLIFTDVLYDSVTELDFVNLQITVGSGVSDARAIPIKSQSVTEPLRKAEAEWKPPNYKKVFGTSEGEVNISNSGDTTIVKSEKAAPKSFDLSIPQSYRPLVSFTTDLYLSFVFWSIYTSLIPSLFYFSVWELGIAGAELALVAILSPVLLGSRVFRGWASSKNGRIVLHVLSLTGMLAYALPKPTHRLMFVTFGTVFLCIGAVVDWAGLSGLSVGYQSTLIGLGLILSSLSKLANHSNNPVWPMLDNRSGGYNKTGLVLAVLAVWELATRPPLSERQPSESTDTKNSEALTAESTIPRSLRSVSLGSLIFSMHCFLVDSSTIIAWTWTGYPIRGPVPHLHGALTLLAQSAGLLLPLVTSSVTRSPVWFCFGAASATILYVFDDWLGYAGGLGLVGFFMSIIPQTFRSTSETNLIGRTYFLSFLSAIVLYLANVWTVAYAFVPGGDLLRERSDLVLFSQILMLAPAFQWRRSSTVEVPVKPSLSKMSKLYTCSTLALVAAISVIVSLYRTPVNAPSPYRPGPRIIRAGIWTVHFGMDNEGRDSQRGMRDLIKDLELDIVGLLETDLHRPVYGNRDLTRVLVEDLDYFVDIGPGPNKHTWGAALLSKFPIINSTHHLLPSPHGELAPAISAFLNVWGTEIMVVVSHNGQEEDPLDRELQSIELARIMNATYPTPVIFLGYVVTQPHSSRPSPYSILVEDGQVHDIDALDYERWCEYILYRGLYRTSYLRMSRGKITDTELQVGQFVVPRFGYNVTDDSEDARYLRRNKEVLPVEHWFPMEYYGNERTGGKNGHYYHVFNTPLYYAVPEGAIV